MKLGGWHRLWILACVLYLCVVAGGAFILYPKKSSVSVWQVFEKMPPESGKKLKNYHEDCLSMGVSSQSFLRVGFEDSHHELFFPRSISKEELGALSDEFHDAIPITLKHKQRSFLLWTPLFWVIPCIVLYILGRSIGWVYRGFKKSE